MNDGDQKQMLRWRILASAVAAAVFLAIGIGIFMWLSSLKRAPERIERQTPRTLVQTISMVEEPYTEMISGYGKARSLRRADVAAEVAGVIKWVSPELEAGATVDEGEDLIHLDSRDLQQAVELAAADLAQAEANLKKHKVDQEGLGKRLAVARREFETSQEELARAEELAGSNVLSQQERDRQLRATQLLERQVLDLDSQLAASDPLLEADAALVKRAKASYERAKLDLARTAIRSPYAGRIETRAAELGSRVAPGSILFGIVDTQRIEVPIALAASRFGSVTENSTAVIRRSENAEPAWTGRVARISPTVDSLNRTFDVFLVVENTEEENTVPPGAFVLATVSGQHHENVMVIPRSAFLQDTVYVVDQSGGEGAIAVRRTPHIVRLLPDVALVDGGVEPGDQVIITNLEKIADGTRVRVREQETTAPSPNRAFGEGSR